MKTTSEGKEFFSEIKEARIQHGLTIKQVSDLTGVPYRSLQNWEAGVRKCPDYVTKMIVTIINQTNGQCRFCDDCDVISEMVCYIPKDNGNAIDISVNYCPNCGAKLNK